MKKICILFFLLSVSLLVFSQKIITGSITDSLTNNLLGGVSIGFQKGKARVISAANGSFSIPMHNQADTLRISHTGFLNMDIPVSMQTTLPLSIPLQPDPKQLGEVIINTGFQSLPRERLTGSFNVINNNAYNQQQGTNIINRLESISNGLYFDRTTGSAPKITIRGLSSILGPRAPLIILDNFPYEGNIDNINPNDVENITILKDAAAASIWGTRAGNGVIVITTKKARYNQQLQLAVTSNICILDKPDLFYIQNISAAGFIESEQFLFGKGFYNSQLNSASRPPVSPVVEILAKKAAGSITGPEADLQISAFKNNDLRNDFNRYVSEKGINRQHSISLSAGSNKLSWKFSAGLDQNIETLKEKYQRFTLRSENNFRLNEKLQMSAGLVFTQSKNTDGRTGYPGAGTINGKSPVYTKLADDAGNPISAIRGHRQAYLDTAGAGKLLNWDYYPLLDYKYVDNTNNLHDIIANLGLNYKYSRHLSVDIRYQFQKQSSVLRTHYTPDSYFARNMVNAYTQLNRSTGVVTYKIPKGGIIDLNNAQQSSQNFRAQLNYAGLWGRHNLNAIAGSDIRESLSNSNSFRTYGYNDNILTSGTVDYTTAFPNFISGAATFISNGVGYTSKTNRYLSYFANAGYTYNNKYTFTVSGRRDASNLFGTNTNNKWTPLWSAGLGWDIKKENFYPFRHFSLLKWQLTAGVSGNADPARSAVTTLVYVVSSPYVQVPIARIEQFNNPGLRWEKVKMLNMAIDFATANRRLHGSVEYYHKKATDLFGTEAIDYTGLPAPTITKNVASIKGHGWDFTLNSTNTTGRLKWSTELNLNTNKDRVIDYYLASQQGSNYTNSGKNISAIIGKPVYAVYSYRWAGLNPQTGDPQGIYQGQVSKDYTALTGSNTSITDLVYNGPALPTVFGNLANNISWKNLSLSIRLTGKFGHYFQRSSLNYAALFSNRDGHADYALRWQNPGDEKITNVPSMVYPVPSQRDNFYRFSEILVQKADHIRLQYITVAYDFANNTKIKRPFTSMRLYANFNNLGIIWRANKYKIDPDFYNYENIPIPKNMILGLNIVF